MEGKMADTVHIGENSPEYVAYLLMHECAKAEKINTLRQSTSKPSGETTRKWLLETYAECLKAVKGDRSAPNQSAKPNPAKPGEQKYVPADQE
jgi:hypothetical protein